MKKTVIILILFTLLFFYLLGSRKKEEEAEEISCYDYIVQTMALPQYWNEFNPLVYSDSESDLYTSTGWTLMDEQKAVFIRGNQASLSLCFNEATSENQISEEYLFSSEPYIQKYDFISDEVERLFYQDNTILKMSQFYNFPPKNDAHQLNPKTEIKNTMETYENAFKKAGCPLLKQPEGTLESYKNKTTQEKVQPLFTYRNYEKEEYPMVKSTSEFLEKTVEEQEPVFLKKDNEFKEFGYYSPTFLFLEMEKDDHSYFEHLNYQPLTMRDFVKEMVVPALEKIYDEPRLFGLENPDGKNPLSYGMEIDAFKEGIQVDQDTLVVVYWLNQRPEIGVLTYLDSNGDKFKECIDYLNDLAVQKGKDILYTDRDLFDFELHHNLNWQRLLGLR